MSHVLTVFALLASLAFAREAGRASAVVEAAPSAREPASAHDFHVSYGRMAVEGASAAVRFRFFADDLEKALGEAVSDDPASWSGFEGYVSDSFRLVVNGDTLGGLIIGSGEDVMDKEPVRWFLIQFTAADTIRSVSLRNELLFDTFDDQKNIMQFRHFPSERNGSLYFTHDRPAYDLEF